MHKRKILIIGEVYVDQHLDIIENGYSTSRLGGIFHAARSCDALNMEYALAYYAPNYLVKDIEKFGIDVLRASNVYCLGNVDKAPNVMLIGQSDESGNQLYENILCRQAEYISILPLMQVLDDFTPTDIIIFPGRYGNARILSELSDYEGKIYIDMNYDCDDILDLNSIKIQTVFLSTSSTSYEKFFKETSYDNLITYFRKKNVSQLLIKENRGGSWLYDFSGKTSYEAPAHIGTTIHSVGVGDVYDIAFMSEILGSNIADNMAFAAWVSSLYAKTIQQEIFKENTELIVQNIQEFTDMEGIRVPWNERVNYPIYMAAPDFDYVDTKKLDVLEESLLYHNFKPRRPIQENGQVNKDMDINEERAIFAEDMRLLSECKIMIATLLYNDQGTLVEIGNYQANGKPIILYDPYLKLDNMFLKNSCTYYCKTKSQVIDAVFIEVSRMVKNGE
jgi:nucleoside 2-deoxyribosyltransferase